jgi:putative ABC transport system substrate-binding protein
VKRRAGLGGLIRSQSRVGALPPQPVPRRLPVVFYWPDAAEMGALISYHPDVADNFKRAAGYVDRILRGERPAELPVQQPTRYELVVNGQVARRLGIRLPPEFLLRADRVIE